MTKRNVHTSKGLLTRREFLVGGGAVLAVAAFAACSNKVATTTSGTSSSTNSSTNADNGFRFIINTKVRRHPEIDLASSRI